MITSRKARWIEAGAQLGNSELPSCEVRARCFSIIRIAIPQPGRVFGGLLDTGPASGRRPVGNRWCVAVFGLVEYHTNDIHWILRRYPIKLFLAIIPHNVVSLLYNRLR